MAGNDINEILPKIGQLFVIGFPGETPPPPLLHFIAEEQIGGTVLFEENCLTHLQARQNIERISSILPSNYPFIAVDQEGGRVCRLRGAPAEYRAAADYGEQFGIDRFREDYSRSAVYMGSLGINLNLAPVADIFLNEENSCLKERCFGRTPEKVAEFVKVAVEVSSASGIFCCLKHFPGLGAAKIDPHDAAAIAEFDRFVWQQREKIPFDAGVRAGADILMTTHLKVPQFDEIIVTGSEKAIVQLARTELEFDGPVISDDLTMEGASSLGSIGQRTVAAFNAGHDLLLFGKDYEAAMQAYDYFVDACQLGDVSVDRICSALDRVTGLKCKMGRSAVL